MKLSELEAVGLTRVGTLTRGADGKAVMAGTVPAEPGLYLFVVGEDVRFVGSTAGGLAKKMGYYRRMHNEAAAAGPVIAQLKRTLINGDSVSIYTRAIGPAERLDWQGLPVSVLRGIEAALIQSLTPAWNRRGRNDGGGQTPAD